MKKICSVNNKGTIRLFEGNGIRDIRLHEKQGKIHVSLTPYKYLGRDKGDNNGDYFHSHGIPAVRLLSQYFFR